MLLRDAFVFGSVKKAQCKAKSARQKTCLGNYVKRLVADVTSVVVAGVVVAAFGKSRAASVAVGRLADTFWAIKCANFHL